MLEALVTLVVVSIGLLGLLGLQTLNIANTQVSNARSIATMAADNMAERMRANPAGLNSNSYADVNNPAAGTAPSDDCASSVCTPAQMASFDAYQWDLGLSRLLPNGRGRVQCVDADTGDADACSLSSPHVISILWSESDKVADREGANDKCTAFNDAGDNVTDRCFQTTFLP